MTPTQRAAEKIVAHYRDGITYEVGPASMASRTPQFVITKIIDAELAQEPVEWMRKAAEEIATWLRDQNYAWLKRFQGCVVGTVRLAENPSPEATDGVAAILARHRDAEVERLREALWWQWATDYERAQHGENPIWESNRKMAIGLREAAIGKNPTYPGAAPARPDASKLVDVARKLSVELMDDYIESIRLRWGNTNAGVLQHWRDEVRAALASWGAVR